MNGERPLWFAELPADPALSRFVQTYWRFEVRAGAAPGLAHHVWPDGCVSLVFYAKSGAAQPPVVLGPRREALTLPVTPEDSAWGVRLRPQAGAALLGLPGPALRDQVAPLALLRPGSPLAQGAAVLADALAGERDPARACARLDEWLGVVTAAAPLPDARVGDAVDAIVRRNGEQPIAALARTLAMGPRQLQRRFLAAVGLTPKEFARIRRMRAAAAVLLGADEPAWSRVAAERGFADQSHLIREFVALARMSPAAMAARLRQIEHGPVDP